MFIRKDTERGKKNARGFWLNRLRTKCQCVFVFGTRAPPAPVTARHVVQRLIAISNGQKFVSMKKVNRDDKAV